MVYWGIFFFLVRVGWCVGGFVLGEGGGIEWVGFLDVGMGDGWEKGRKTLPEGCSE